MQNPEQYINYNGQDWTALKLWLEGVQAQKIRLLVAATNHDESNKIRGSLAMIQQILALEPKPAVAR